MDVSEFIDTYSDDLAYLYDARRALLTHPLEAHYAFMEYVDASFCRITAVFVVGAIEAMLADWREQRRDEASILDKYFEQGVKNGDRVRNLYHAFRDAGIEVNEEVFSDYLAIKYLRNTIIHGRWHDHEKEWLDHRGFPADARKLTTDHLHKMDHVLRNIPEPNTAVGLEHFQECALAYSDASFVELRVIFWHVAISGASAYWEQSHTHRGLGACPSSRIT